MVAFTELSLFSGGGGGLLATKHLLGWQTVCYVEWDKYAVEVLKARIRDGYLDDAPIWDDAFTFDGQPWVGLVDVVTAGFPCQPFSSAGKGLAENDPRNGWPAVIRILREVRPRYAFLENVPGLISKPYFRRILGDLAEAGFDIQHDCISAQEVGAPHLRERLWIVAYSQSGARDIPSEQHRKAELYPGRNGSAWVVADSNSGLGDRAQDEVRAGRDFAELGSQDVRNPRRARDRQLETPADRRQEERDIRNPQWWEVEPNVGRVADGVAARVDRLRATGNGQVPAVVAEAWKRLGEL